MKNKKTSATKKKTKKLSIKEIKKLKGGLTLERRVFRGYGRNGTLYSKF